MCIRSSCRVKNRLIFIIITLFLWAEHEVNNEDEVNEPIEVDANNNIVQDDRTNQMIQELFARKNDDGQDNDGIYD